MCTKFTVRVDKIYSTGDNRIWHPFKVRHFRDCVDFKCSSYTAACSKIIYNKFQKISKNFKKFQKISKNFKKFQKISNILKEKRYRPHTLNPSNSWIESIYPLKPIEPIHEPSNVPKFSRANDKIQLIPYSTSSDSVKKISPTQFTKLF